MKILAVDISGLFSTHWEINQGKEESHAFLATVRAVNVARDGFDRVAICCDSGASWRKLIWPSYKANRVDRGAAYRHQLERTIEQLAAEGCAVFRAPPFSDDANAGGKALYAEADDVIGTLCAWATEGGSSVRILSGDKDLLQLVGEDVEVINYKGDVYGPPEVMAKLGIPPERIPDFLALSGDKSDNFKPYDGIGDKRAVDLIKICGCALDVFKPEHWDKLHEYIGNAAAGTIKLAGREPAEKCLQIATVLRDLEINFDPLLAEPIRRPVAPKTQVDFSPAVPVSPQTSTPQAEHGRSASVGLVRRAEATIEKFQFNPFALEPTDSKQAWDLAQALFASAVLKKFPTPEAVLLVILEGRAMGLPSVIALKNAYIVKGNVGWSARILRGLAIKSGLCDYFDLVDSTTDLAKAVCKRVGRPEFVVESSLELAQRRGLIKEPGTNRRGEDSEGNKWFTDPMSMLVADVERRGARMGWPDVVAGLYTPDELDMGVTAEGVQIIEAAA